MYENNTEKVVLPNHFKHRPASPTDAEPAQDLQLSHSPKFFGSTATQIVDEEDSSEIDFSGDESSESLEDAIQKKLDQKEFEKACMEKLEAKHRLSIYQEF